MPKLYVLHTALLSYRDFEIGSFVLTIGAPAGSLPILSEISTLYCDELGCEALYTVRIGDIQRSKDNYIIDKETHAKYIAARDNNVGPRKTAIEISDEELEQLIELTKIRSVSRERFTFTEELAKANHQALGEAHQDPSASEKKTSGH